MVTLPGATVRLGAAALCEVNGAGERGGVGTTSRPCRRVAQAPFVNLPVSPALHEVRVAAGPGSYELTVDRVRISPNQSTTIANIGSTWDFREIADRLVLNDTAGVPALRNNLLAKSLYGVPLIELSLVLMVTAAVLRALQFQLWLESAARASRVATVIATGLLAVTGAYVVARLAPLFEWAPFSRYILAGVGVGGAVFAAWRAFRAKPPNAIAPVAACGFALSFVAFGGEMARLGMAVALASAVGSALWLTRGAPGASPAVAPAGDQAVMRKKSNNKRKRR